MSMWVFKIYAGTWPTTVVLDKNGKSDTTIIVSKLLFQMGVVIIDTDGIFGGIGFQTLGQCIGFGMFWIYLQDFRDGLLCLHIIFDTIVIGPKRKKKAVRGKNGSICPLTDRLES